MPNTEFIRGTVQAKIYAPEGAVVAGFYDQVAAGEQVMDLALAEAERLAKLPRGAYVGTRAIVRGTALDHIEMTLEADMASSFSDT